MSPAKRHQFPAGKNSLDRNALREARIGRHARRYRYAISIDDTEIDQLVQAICPESVAKRAWECLRWQREGERNAARKRAAAAPVLKLKHH